MARITYLDPSGETHTLEGEAGLSVMNLALRNGVPGIIADCGGFLNCATCHVYVATEWQGVVGTATEEEGEMLDGGMAERLPGSRLSCQVVLHDELDGLCVTIAPEQM